MKKYLMLLTSAIKVGIIMGAVLLMPFSAYADEQSQGNLMKIQRQGSNNPIFECRYDSDGRPYSMGGNGSWEHVMSFDSNGRPIEGRWGEVTDTYLYNEAGLCTSKRTVFNKNGNLSAVNDFDYDENGRILQWRSSVNPVVGEHIDVVHDYVYDTSGNYVIYDTYPNSSDSPLSVEYDELGRFSVVSYNDIGDLKKRTISYDEQGRISKITTELISSIPVGTVTGHSPQGEPFIQKAPLPIYTLFVYNSHGDVEKEIVEMANEDGSTTVHSEKIYTYDYEHKKLEDNIARILNFPDIHYIHSWI